MAIDLKRVRHHRDRTPTRSVQLARGRAHEAFDQIWKLGHATRSEAYDWLSQEMDVEEFHMKTATIEECERVVQLSKEFLAGLRSVNDEEADPWGLKG